MPARDRNWEILDRSEAPVHKLCSALLVTVAFLCFSYPTFAQQSKPEHLALNQTEASHFASLAMKCIRKEYPNKPDHTINDGDDVRSPRAMHPAFYGCFDWHSTVHGHWMLLRLLRLYPDLSEVAEIRAALNGNLTAENLASEVAYLKQTNRTSFE